MDEGGGFFSCIYPTLLTTYSLKFSSTCNDLIPCLRMRLIAAGHSLGGLVPRKHEDTHIDEIAGWLIAGIGFYVQLAYNFSAPFPLNIVLLPFSIVEWVLAWEITSGS